MQREEVMMRTHRVGEHGPTVLTAQILEGQAMGLSTQALAASYAKAWADHDVEAIVALHTPDSVFHVHGLAEPSTGPAAIERAITEMFGQATDLSFATTRGHLGADHIVFEYVMSGTSDAGPFSCEGVDVISIKDGLVQRKDTYLDLVAYQRQGLPGLNRATARGEASWPGSGFM
jgi:ketosteroid isomerase-like protein